LLALLGLHSTHGHTWKFDVTQIVNHLAGDASLQLPMPLDQLQQRFWPEFKLMVEDQELCGPELQK
jgi:hypothetical protein